MKEVYYLDGRPETLPDEPWKDNGYESKIYKINQDRVIKIYRDRADPLYKNEREKYAAEKRLADHKTKLLYIPQNLPKRIIVPTREDLLTDKKGAIIGYSMPFILNSVELHEYTTIAYREKLGIENWKIVNNIILPVFRDLHCTVLDTHENKTNVIIGDFNPTNILVQGKATYIIDADSMQFAEYRCELYKPDQLDPMLMDRVIDNIVKKDGEKYTTDSDWYAYNVMLLQNLLLVHPYDGIYEIDELISSKERVDKGITIFHDKVSLSSDVICYDKLPDDLLHHFYEVFEKGKRGKFPAYFLDMRWTTCSQCGAEHARNTCPHCHGRTRKKPPIEPRRRGDVKATTIFDRQDHNSLSYYTIEATEYHQKQIRYLYRIDKTYIREDGSIIYSDSLTTGQSFGLAGKYVVFNNTILDPYDQSDMICSHIGYFAKNYNRINDKAMYGLYSITDSPKFYSLERIDNSKNITRELLYFEGEPFYWIGENFGLICSTNADIFKLEFIFDAQNMENRHLVNRGRLEGKLIDAKCYFDKDLAWLLTSIKKDGKTSNYCMVINQKGTFLKGVKTQTRENNWLFDIHNKCAVGNSLLSPTLEGIEQVTLDDNELLTTEYPDSKDFVNSRTKLMRGEENEIYVIAHDKITKLQFPLKSAQEIKDEMTGVKKSKQRGVYQDVLTQIKQYEREVAELKIIEEQARIAQEREEANRAIIAKEQERERARREQELFAVEQAAREATERDRREQERKEVAEREKQKEIEETRRREQSIRDFNNWWHERLISYRNSEKNNLAAYVFNKLELDLYDDNIGEKFTKKLWYSLYSVHPEKIQENYIEKIVTTFNLYELIMYKDVINDFASLFKDKDNINLKIYERKKAETLQIIKKNLKKLKAIFL